MTLNEALSVLKDNTFATVQGLGKKKAVVYAKNTMVLGIRFYIIRHYGDKRVVDMTPYAMEKSGFPAMRIVIDDAVN